VRTKQDLVDEYFLLTLHDLSNGKTVHEMESVLKFYEELELYEECQGIYEAIQCIKNFNKLYYDRKSKRNN
jgi:hypothetical protein